MSRLHGVARTARSKAPLLPVAVAVASGAVILASRFTSWPLADAAAAVLVEWAVLLAAVATLFGLANLALRHGRIAAGWERTASTPARSRRPNRGRRLLSLALLVIMAVTLAAGVISPEGADSPLSTWLFTFVQYPLQAALFSLLAFYMLSAAYRALRPGGLSAGASAVFVLAGVIFLLTQLAGGQGSWLQAARDWLIGVPTLAGVRGLLLGVALGAAIAGLRVVLGLSRPYAPAEDEGEKSS